MPSDEIQLDLDIGRSDSGYRSSSDSDNAACRHCAVHCTSHPSITARKHTDFETLQGAVRDAVARKQGKRPPLTAAALLLSWKENDLKSVPSEITDLADVLLNGFGINSEHFEIPSTRSEIALRTELLRFQIVVDPKSGNVNDEKGNLLIVYYGGHGYPEQDDEIHDTCFWAAGQRNPQATLDWVTVQNQLIESTTADVLIILDCCYSGGAARGVNDGNRRLKGSKELLTAGSKEYRASAGLLPGQAATTTGATGGRSYDSFTRVLINELGAMTHGDAFTVRTLHMQLDERRCGQRRLRHQPQLFTLAASDEAVTLFPVSKVDLGFSPSLQRGWVLLSVPLSGSPSEGYTTDVAWLEFLATGFSMQGFHDQVEIGAAFISNSTLLILSLPLDLWAFLPRDLVYTYLGQVKGKNLLLEERCTKIVTGSSSRDLGLAKLKERTKSDSRAAEAGPQGGVSSPSTLAHAGRSINADHADQHPSLTDSEKIALLVEISRDAGLDPVLQLARAVLYHRREPRWEKIILPLGRSFRLCKEEYDKIRRLYTPAQGRPIQPYPAGDPPDFQSVHPTPSPPLERSFQEEGFFTSELSLLNLPPPPPFSRMSPEQALQPAAPMSHRKRVRLSKEEIAKTEAEVAAQARSYVSRVRRPVKFRVLSPSIAAGTSATPPPTEASGASVEQAAQKVESQQGSATRRPKRQKLDVTGPAESEETE